MILYHVYSDNEVLQRLRAELEEGHASGRIEPKHLQVSALDQLPYLTGVIMEGLRLSPGLATRMARIAPDRALAYGEWTIPAGTPVGMTTLLMHTDESLYPDPTLFRPERWADVEARKKADRTFAPFSRGTRICLGMQ
jgi:cytochrome P450